MSMRGPIKMSTTFLVFFPNHLFLPECGWVSYCMEGEEYGQPNSNWAETHFWKTCSDFLGKEDVQKRRPFCHTSTFSIFQTILLHVGAFWEQLKFFLCLSIHVFGCWLHFSQGLEVVFVMPGPGLSSSRFWSCWYIFPFTFLWFHVFFYHGCEEPFTFLAVSLTFGSHALPIWDVFSLLWVGFPDKLQDCVFSPCCEPFLLLRMGLCNSFLLFKLC